MQRVHVRSATQETPTASMIHAASQKTQRLSLSVVVFVSASSRLCTECVLNVSQIPRRAATTRLQTAPKSRLNVAI